MEVYNKMNDPIDIKGIRKSGGISDLLEGYMSKFKVYDNGTLFDTNDDTQLIRQGICPVCLCSLKVSKKGDVFCNSKKHLTITKKRLFISSAGMKKII